MTAAVVAGLQRERIDTAQRSTVAEAIARDEPIDESLHTDLKKMLYTKAGLWAMVDAGYELGRRGAHPLVEFLAGSRSPAELLYRFDRLEPLLHFGNRTRCTPDEQSVEVRHEGRGHNGPGLPESLFVVGAQIGMLERIGVCGVEAVVNESLTVWPRRARVDSSASGVDDPTAQRDRTVSTWIVRWRSAPSSSAPEWTGSLALDIRRSVAERPPSTVPSTVRRRTGLHAMGRRRYDGARNPSVRA